MKVYSKPKYMIASAAFHPGTKSDLSREQGSLCQIEGETDTHFIGNWVTGFGFINVEFPKKSTRPLTEDEKIYYSNETFLYPWGPVKLKDIANAE